ncbi:nucleoporin autopeptidase-domain-containing protein [Ilyonectria robusta]|uniref:nucleoporin autopeptidase-domain-containing protein n=1 Tax=Ilyonectria robusta TaxID=1079257 RepID=UPI001E8EBA92|nr:nucleoporin autopeptidase-domain-containing protein [Ilyonectria robusta]KAH8662725.1 nucleoporin autopeptidase-domain-containing protein [Ilyonectria robusta]
MPIQQPQQAASLATSQPQMTARIDDITAYGAPWLFLTAEEGQQLQDRGPLAVRQPGKGKPRCRSMPPGFKFRHSVSASRQSLPNSPKFEFRYGSNTPSNQVEGRPKSSNWLLPPNPGRQLIRSPSAISSSQHFTSEGTASASSHREALNTAERSLSKISRELKTLDINKSQAKDLFSSLAKHKEDILAMNKDQRKSLAGLTIGRDNVGLIRFKVPVDLTNIDLEGLLGGLVILETRSATVYPDSVGNKPPIGKGLNVPALISLEHSWPRRWMRGRGQPEVETGPQLTSHIERLKNVEGTRFESYSEEDGVWTFSVNHFSTYIQVTYKDGNWTWVPT